MSMSDWGQSVHALTHGFLRKRVVVIPSLRTQEERRIAGGLSDTVQPPHNDVRSLAVRTDTTFDYDGDPGSVPEPNCVETCSSGRRRLMTATCRRFWVLGFCVALMCLLGVVPPALAVAPEWDPDEHYYR